MSVSRSTFYLASPVAIASLCLTHAAIAKPISPELNPTSPHTILAQALEVGEPAQPSDSSFEDDFLSPDPDAESLDAEDLDTDIGEVKILPRSTEAQTSQREPIGQLFLRSSILTNSNVTGTEFEQAGDITFINQARFLLTPKLGPDTRLIATAQAGLTRFAEEGDGNYDAFGYSIGVQQRLTRGTFAQIGWMQDYLFDTDDGNRLLKDNSARLLIGRQDQLGEKLRLDSSYELRTRFTDPDERSRISNSLGLWLRYNFTSAWQGTMGYRFMINDYTQTERFDTLHQLQATTTYAMSKDTFLTGYASYLFGNSSEAMVDLENFSVGVSLGVNLPLF